MQHCSLRCICRSPGLYYRFLPLVLAVVAVRVPRCGFDYGCVWACQGLCHRGAALALSPCAASLGAGADCFASVTQPLLLLELPDAATRWVSAVDAGRVPVEQRLSLQLQTPGAEAPSAWLVGSHQPGLAPPPRLAARPAVVLSLALADRRHRAARWVRYGC